MIRTVILEEAAILRDLSCLTYRDTFQGTTSEENLQEHLDTAYALPRLEKELQDPEVAYYFYQEGEKLLGYLRLNIGSAQTESIHDNSMEIERIYIHPDYKGRGLGQEFMNFALEQARALGKTAIWLGVWEHNKPALGFYQKNGFHQVGQHNFVMGDDVQTDLLYLKELSL
ncbi:MULTISPECIES: N-acetyltransferase [unclassified Streptococcus]|uniref:GNAT family N-acetyltransferase n=1 Tax=Streptococcus sp. 19428wA2_WM07 TaxID=2782468 RepID=UPI001071F9F9|nr:GNAT family N-acetyltransferase [Streptococcus sp. 19428wA2_WM07]TFU27998.1 GNAT family N-acetyltransferase [Streptococcus sp. WM07]